MRQLARCMQNSLEKLLRPPNFLIPSPWKMQLAGKRPSGARGATEKRAVAGRDAKRGQWQREVVRRGWRRWRFAQEAMEQQRLAREAAEAAEEARTVQEAAFFEEAERAVWQAAELAEMEQVAVERPDTSGQLWRWWRQRRKKQ
jgi:hypothetical protein